MLNFDFSNDAGYLKPYRIVEFNFIESNDLVFNQQIKLNLLLNQPITQKLLQKETLTKAIKATLKLNQNLIKGFSLTANTALEVKLAQELYKSITGYGKAVTLFNEPLPIQQISLTFDQLGQPLLFYRVGENTLKLYWYDPVAQENVLTNFGVGKDPTACFDFPQDTGQPFTDALLFYVRDDQVFMRVQRDRYAIEYPCPAIQPSMKVLSAGLRVDNRLQVVYQYRDDIYVPPVTPVPPIVVDGSYKYYFSGRNSGIETQWRMDGAIANTEFEIGMMINGFSYVRGGGLASEGIATGGGFISNIPPHTLFAITAGLPSIGLQQVRGYPELLIETTTAKRVFNLYYQNYPPIALMLKIGLGEFDYSQLRFVFGAREPSDNSNRKLTIYGTFRNIGQQQLPELIDVAIYDGSIPAGSLAYDLYNNSQNSRLFFGTSLSVRGSGIPVYQNCLCGYISQCHAKDGDTLTKWDIGSNMQQQQPSVPIGNNAAIVNHNNINWAFITQQAA